MSWEIIQLTNEKHTTKALKIFKDLGFKNTPMDPLHDMEWLLDGRDCDENLYYCSYADQAGNAGHCMLRRQARSVKLFIGEFTIYRYPIYRYELWSTPLIRSQNEAQSISILNEFLSYFEQNMMADEALSIEGLPLDSPFYKCIYETSSERLNLQLGKAFMHQAISFPETFEAYLQQMSKRSRKSVQYSQRKLFKEHRTELFECHSEAEIETFLDEAIAVSKKTYQWNLLGIGLRDREELKESLRKWDRRAKLHCFILRCDDHPVAFMLGYIYQACYFYIDVGYDPDWMNFSPGSVLQMAVIEKLYSQPVPPKRFDFSTGYGEHKARFGNCEQEEVNLLLLVPTTKNKIFVHIYKLINSTSTGLVKLLDRLGIKKQLKKMIRRFF